MADLDIKQLKGLSEELEKMSAVSSKAADRVGRIRSQLRDLKLTGKEGSTEFIHLSEALKLASKRSDKLSDNLRVIKNYKKGLSEVFPKSTIKTMKEYNDHLEKMGEAYVRNIETAKASGKLTEKQYKRMLEDVVKFRDELAKASSEPIKLVIETESADKGVRKAARTKLAESAGGAARGVLGGLGGMTGMSSKTMSGAADAFKNTWESGKTLTSSFSKLKGMMDAAGKGSGMLVGAFSLLSKAFMANPIMLMVAGAQALISVVNELDKMIKGLNRSWMEMAGSPVLISDVRKSMKEFNDSIYNVGRNMKLGLKASDISEFFKTMSSAGLTTEGVSKRVGSFNESIETGFKLSRQFGVSFSDMGQMMTSQMLDLRSSLEDVSDGFKSMSYDAAVAGVQSQKFYQVVESASMSLSFYGNFLKSTSARLRDFVQTGTMGFKDASQTVQELMNTFKGMGMDQRRAVVNIIGEDEVRKMFNEREGEMDKEIAKMGKNISVMEADPKVSKEQLEAAKNRLQAMQGDRRNLREALQTGDVTALGSMLEVLSDKVLGAASKVLERTGVDFFKDKAAAFSVLQSQFGWGIDMVNKAMKKSNVMMDTMRQSYGELTDDLKKAGNKEMFKKIGDDVKEYMKDPGTKTLEEFTSGLKSKLTGDLKLSEKEAGTLIELLSQSQGAFADYMEWLGGKQDKTFGQIATARGTEGAKEIQAELSDEKLGKIVEATTPLADYLEIGKENVKYALAGSDMMANISVAATETAKKAGGILSFLLRGSRGGAKLAEDERGRYEKLQAAKSLYSTGKDQLRGAGYEDRAVVYERAEQEVDKAIKEMDERLYKFDDELDRVKEVAISSSTKAVERNTKNQIEIEKAESDIRAKTSDEYVKKLSESQAKENNAEVEALKKRVETLKTVEARYLTMLGVTTPTSGTPVKTTSDATEPIAATQDAPETAAFDFSAKSKGWVKVSKGDYVIDSASLAKGMGMGRGQLMNAGPGIMKGSGESSSGVSIGNVELNFNAPLNGNPEEYRKMFVEAVNDVVSKRLYGEKSRVS